MAFTKYAGDMPARIGIASERLFPSGPWQGVHVSALTAPGVSRGPAETTPARSTRTRAATAVIIGAPLLRLGKDVGPDAAGPALGVLGVDDRVTRRQLLLDLHDLVVLDLVGVD